MGNRKRVRLGFEFGFVQQATGIGSSKYTPSVCSLMLGAVQEKKSKENYLCVCGRVVIMPLEQSSWSHLHKVKEARIMAKSSRLRTPTSSTQPHHPAPAAPVNPAP